MSTGMMRWTVALGLLAGALACGGNGETSLPNTSGGLDAGTGTLPASGGAGAAGPLAAGSGGAGGSAPHNVAGGNAGTSSAAGGGGSGTASRPPAELPDDDAGMVSDAGPTADASASDDASTPPTCPDCCPDGFPRGKADSKLRKLASLTPSPEGVAVCPNGDVFVALDGSGELWRIPLDGQPSERWARLGDRRPAGLTCDEHGRLFAAIFGTVSGASPGIVMVTARDADPVELPQPEDGSQIGGLNGIVAVAGIGVYASDTTGNAIVLAHESVSGTFTVRKVASDVTLANGLAYDAANRTLYAVASGAGRVLAFPVAADGALGPSKQVSPGALILFMDGVTVDERGAVYVADYLGGAVIRAKDGARIAPAAGSGNPGLTNPASLDFRGGTLLITDYRVMAPDQPGGLYALDLGVCGGRVSD